MLDIILKATHFNQICKSDDDYKKLAKLLHPDRCKDSMANDALVHLNSLRDEAEKGLKFNDESGEYVTTGFTHTWSGNVNKDLLTASYNGYNTLVKEMKKVYSGERLDHFMRYIPHNYSLTNDKLSFTTALRCIPLSHMIKKISYDPLKYKHYNWVYSRMIEFCVMLESVGIGHNGISPESVFIIPETHGITVSTFFHSKPFNQNLKTLNGRNRSWYPDKVFTNKISEPGIDITLAKKLTISNLGDNSGSGVVLRLNKEINPNVLTYFMRSDNNALNSMKEWREILHNNYKSEFLPLNI